MQGPLFIGVDVGTGSARAALVTADGQVLSTHISDIRTWNPRANHYEQSSDNIWRAVCQCVRTVILGHPIASIAGIGFDATCSLVAVDANDCPVSLSHSDCDDQNVILWMDHRAAEEAEAINATGHPLLKYVGGQVSLEMQCPKLLWCKRHLSTSWQRTARFFDLPDYLTYRSTGNDSRSLCSVVCKWNYDAVVSSWSAEFLALIGLDDLTENNYAKIGNVIRPPGAAVGGGLNAVAAAEFGLMAGIPVATSMIDAHAGAVALFGCVGDAEIASDVQTKMALICGTSSCHMSVTTTPVLANGVWGPYEGALFQRMYLHEGGQSATGILLDHIIKNHPAYASVKRNAATLHPFEYLNRLLERMADEANITSTCELTRNVHVWPDYHGNRCPLSDASMRGMISGLSMSSAETDLAIMYLAFIQALAYGTRHILDSLKMQGRSSFKSLIVCGGLSKNRLFVQTHADVCDMPVLVPNASEAVLVGAAILGACAAEQYASLVSASMAMGGSAKVIRPGHGCTAYHERKYKVFLKMLDDQTAYNRMMSE